MLLTTYPFFPAIGYLPHDKLDALRCGCLCQAKRQTFILATLCELMDYILQMSISAVVLALSQLRHVLLSALSEHAIRHIPPYTQNAWPGHCPGSGSCALMRTPRHKKGQYLKKAWDKHCNWQSSEQGHHQSDGADGTSEPQITGRILKSSRSGSQTLRSMFRSGGRV